MTKTMNVMAGTGHATLVHLTEDEISTGGQSKHATACGRRVNGYVLPINERPVTCPRCVALVR